MFPAGGVPTAEGALLDALQAVRPDGSADHAIRIQAARAILSTPVVSPEAEQQARETRIYLPAPPREDDGMVGTPSAQLTDPFKPQDDEVHGIGVEAGVE